MSIFKKKETLTQNITYMAVMAAINVIFALLTTLVPALMFLIVFVLPLSNTIVALFCKKRYFPIYAIVTIGLSALVTCWNISDTLFYVVPSVFTGFLFAVLIESKIKSIWLILGTALLQVCFSYAFIPLINFMYGRNFISDFAAIFGLRDYQYLYYVTPAVILVIDLIQSGFSYAVTKEEIKKFGFEVNDKDENPLILLLVQIVLVGLLILFAFVLPEFVLFVLVLIIFIGMNSLVNLFTKVKIPVVIMLVAAIFINIFVFAICYRNIPKPISISLVGIMFVLFSIINLINNSLFNKSKEKDKIPSERS